MYYTKQVGFGPFKKWVLMEKVTPRHKETRVPLKNGFIYTEDGARPISSAKISITPDGYIVFNGTTKTSVKARSFEAFSRGFVFTTDDKTKGYVASNGNVVNPTETNGEVIVDVDVYDAFNTLFYEKVDAKTGETFYIIGNTLGGGEQKQWGRFTSVETGKKSNGLPRTLLILGNQDGTKTVVNMISSTQTKHQFAIGDNFVVLCDSATKIERNDQLLYILSTTRKHTGHESVLEGFALASISTPNPELKFMEYDVKEFDTFFRELITYNGKTSTVYDIAPHSEKYTVTPKFTKEGVIKNVAPMFCDDDIYMQTNNGQNTLLMQDGTPCPNPELERIKSIRDRFGYSYIIDVETKDGVKQGLFRSGDLSTLIPPACERIVSLDDEDGLVVGTYGKGANSTFGIYKLEEYKTGAYLPPETLLKPNNYFKPAIMYKDSNQGEKKVIEAETSVGDIVVIDCTGRDNTPAVSNAINYANTQLGYPSLGETRQTEFIESEDILIK